MIRPSRAVPLCLALVSLACKSADSTAAVEKQTQAGARTTIPDPPERPRPVVRDHLQELIEGIEALDSAITASGVSEQCKLTVAHLKEIARDARAHGWTPPPPTVLPIDRMQVEPWDLAGCRLTIPLEIDRGSRVIDGEFAARHWQRDATVKVKVIFTGASGAEESRVFEYASSDLAALLAKWNRAFNNDPLGGAHVGGRRKPLTLQAPFADVPPDSVLRAHVLVSPFFLPKPESTLNPDPGGWKVVQRVPK